MRFLSRISVRLLAFNLLLVFLPAGGVLLLGSYERHLLEAQERTMTQEGRLLAAALEATGQAIEIAARRGEVERCWAERLKARILLYGGRVQEAEKTLADALSALPDNASDAAREDFTQGVLRLRVEACVAKKDLASARSVLEELRAAVAASASAWHQQLFAFVVAQRCVTDSIVSQRHAVANQPRQKIRIAEPENHHLSRFGLRRPPRGQCDELRQRPSV